VAQYGCPEYAVRFGLSAIKNVGEGPVGSIIAAREAEPFASLEDFCSRVERQSLNKRVIEALIKSGAMDELPGTRRQKLAILDHALSAGIETQKARESGQTSLFDLFGDGPAETQDNVNAIPLPAINETSTDKKEELAWEKELLGMYASQHPIADALTQVDTTDTTPLSQVAAHVGETLNFIGMLTGTRRITTKKGDPMLVAVLEDLESSIEIVAFPRVLERYSDLLNDDTVLQIKAKVDNRRDTLQLIVDECAEVTYSTQEATTDLPESDVEPEAALEEMTTDDPVPLEEPAEEPAPTPEPQPITASAPAPPAPPTEPAAQPEQPAPTPEPPAIPTLQGPVKGIRSSKRVSAPAASENHASEAPVPYANGNSNGNGHDAPSGRNLHIRLPRSIDLQADTRRMQDLDELLRAYEGPDQVTLYLPNSAGMVLLRPCYTVNASRELVTELMGVLGEDEVEVH
jgi:DNA polymerase-3 subunit alpha